MISTKHTVIFLYIVMACAVRAASNDVIVDKLKLFVNGREFFIKAMCYNPVPIGVKNMDKEGNLGGGYCSPKMTAHGEWKSACYDSDYFDGSSDDPRRVPAGPASWFKAVWQRDFPEMQAVGANTIRIYNANPTTLQASQDPANNFTAPRGKNHIPFLDMAASYGFKVIFPLFGDYGYIINSPVEQFEQFLRWQIDEVGNHSAILMFTLGNELELNGNPTLIRKVNDYMAYAREYMASKWSRTVPITTAVVDLPESYSSLVRDLDVDVFTTNAGYRGLDFSDLWSATTNGLYQLSCTYNKPVFIGEIGWMSTDGSINALRPNWINSVWKDLVNHIDAGCIGGAFFEYSNEPYTKADVEQRNMGIVSFSVDGNSDQPNVFKVDKLVHMPYIYDAISSGTYEGIAYNMNSDPFALIGRQAHTLSSAPEICSGSYVTPTPIPSGTGSCTTVPMTITPTPSPSTTPCSSPAASTSSASTSTPSPSNTPSASTPSPSASTSSPSASTSSPSASTSSPSASTSSPSDGSSSSSPSDGSSSSDSTDSTVTTPSQGTTAQPLTTDSANPTDHDHNSDEVHPNSASSHIISVPAVLTVLAIFSIFL